MGLIDLKVDQIRMRKHWEGRHKKIERLNTKSIPNYGEQNPTDPGTTSQEVSTEKYSMDLKLYKAVEKGDVDEFISALERVSAEKKLSLPTIFDQLSPPLQNTFLHVAASFGNEDLAGFILYHFQDLHSRTNDKGDTALHLAARAGHYGVVKVVVCFRIYHLLKQRFGHDFEGEYLQLLPGIDESERAQIGVRVLNEEGNTPLHEAVINNHSSVANYLIGKDPEAVYYANKEEKSPLDLAVEHGNVEIMESMLKRTSAGNQNVLDEQLTKEKSLIHAAITHRIKVMEIDHKRQSEQQPTDPSTSQEVTVGTEKFSMDLGLYKAAEKGDVDVFINALERFSAEKKLLLPTIFDQLSPMRNTFLHVAACFGHEDIARFIATNFHDLLSRTNQKGDSALQVAARAAHLGVVDILVSVGNNIENVNEEGNTPLHEAVLNNHERVADLLLKADPKAVYSVNNEGKSPLYLAVEAGNFNLVKTMLNYRFENQNVLDEQLTKGKSVIHASIMQRNKELLQEIGKRKPTLLDVKDEDGQNPLHCAASNGFLEGVQLLLNEFIMDPLEFNDDGFCPIHIASKNGHVDVMQELLQCFPDAREFLNREGQNILHIAAKNGKDNAIKYILKTRGLELLINERDKDGNTPLHLSTINWHPKVVSSLTWDKRVNLKPLNNEGLTALEVAEEYMETMPSYRKRLTWMALMSAGAPKAKLQNRPKVNRVKSMKYEPYNMDYCKDRVNTLLLMSTLVATVTFAAGFTMPGGYNNSEPDQGLATLLSKQKFHIFVICDTIAMYSAIIVAVTLIWAQLGDLNLVLNALRFAIPLLGISLTMMSLAFMVSVYLVVGKLAWLGHFVLIVGIIFVAILLVLFVPLYLPYTSNSLILRYFTYYPFCLLMLASGSYRDHDLEE